MRPHLLRHVLETTAKQAAPDSGLHSLVRQAGFRFVESKPMAPFVVHVYKVDKTKAQKAITQLNNNLLRGKFAPSSVNDKGETVWAKPGHKFSYKAGVLNYRIMDADAQAKAQRLANKRSTTAIAQLALSDMAKQVLWQLFDRSDINDNDIVSKKGRDELIALRLAQNVEGLNYLTEEGTNAAVALDMGTRKAAMKPRAVDKTRPVMAIVRTKKTPVERLNALVDG
jgi:hypothetical protein